MTRETPYVGKFPVPARHPRFRFAELVPGEGQQWCFRTADTRNGYYGWKPIAALAGDEREDCSAVAEQAWRVRAEALGNTDGHEPSCGVDDECPFCTGIDEAKRAVRACRAWGEGKT